MRSMMTDTKPSNLLNSILGSLSGKQTSVDVKPKGDEIHIEIVGVNQRIALKHIKELIEDLLQQPTVPNPILFPPAKEA